MPVRTLTTEFAASDIYTSTITVQGFQRLNVSLRIGSAVSAPAVSAASCKVVLQRLLPGDETANIWRDVQSWSVAAADGMNGGSENITAQPEPETCQYRAGITSFTSGIVNIRLGSS